jgi:hypothetical protein
VLTASALGLRCIGSKALLSLATIAFVLSATDVASAARPPVLHSRPQPPFGYSHRPVCRAVPPGRARCLAEILTVGGAGSGATAAPLLTPGPLGFGPPDLQDAYGIVSEAASAGGTQTVAIVDAYNDPTAESDLATYRSQYSLPACTTAGGCFRKVDQRGGSSYPPANREWESEIALDLDAVSAICPQCHILLVEADSSFTFDLAASANEAAALSATQISNSYGGPEFASETSFDAGYNHPGVAVTASSGDGGYGVEYPAASRYVTAVGGTSLTPAPAAPRGWAESAWSGAGSGCSKYEAKQSWQLDIGCSSRTVADVAAVADPATGAAVYSTVDGGWAVYGGTSLASPIVAAYDALMGPAAASPQYPYSNLSSYFDVTSGSNGLCGGSYLCNAVAGYDGPTGLGSPHGEGTHRAPTTGTGAASEVSPSGAKLNGTVNPNGSATEYSFEYGTSKEYGSTTPTTAAGSGSIAQAVSANVSGLSASTTYHFRILATNTYGTHAGTDNIFTSAGPPVPANTVKPHSVGLPVVGAVLTSSTGTWTGLPDQYEYQWYRCVPVKSCIPSPITGAIASTYTVAAPDLGGWVYAFVRAHNASGWSGFIVSDNSIGPIVAPVPANTAAPHVTGTGQVGSIVSVSTGAWSGSPSAYEYQWWRCVFISGGGCLPARISGATSPAYALAAGDVGTIVWATVRAENKNGWSSFVNSDNAVGPVTAIGAPANTGRPHVSGEPVVGAALTASAGSWSGSPDAYEYEWLDCMPVPGGGCVPGHVGGNAPSYAVGSGDLKGAIYVAVRAHNGGGWSSFVVSDNALGPVAAARAQQTVLAPSITRLAIRPGAFRAAHRGASVAVATGARVTFILSRSAYVSFTVERALSGRRVGGRCVAPRAGNRRRPSCTRYLALRGSFRDPVRGFAAAGSAGFKFTGRLSGRPLAPGSYRLVAVALGALGPRSSATRCAFRIVR